MPRRATGALRLSRLETVDRETHDLAVIIETPKGSRSKLAYDEERDVFTLHKVLPEGMSFPFDFGFIPSTLGEDGDPLDVLVLMEESLPPGSLVPARLIGVITGYQEEEDGRGGENDRLIAVSSASLLYKDVLKLSDLPNAVPREVERFFVNYNEEEGKKFEPRGRHGRKRAERLVEEGTRRFRRPRGGRRGKKNA